MVWIPELDSILPFGCRAEKRGRQTDPEFMDAVPEQYRQVIRDQIANESKKPKTQRVKVEKKDDDDEDDKKEEKYAVKAEVKREHTEMDTAGSAASPPDAERACPAAVCINSFGSINKGDIGPPRCPGRVAHGCGRGCGCTARGAD